MRYENFSWQKKDFEKLCNAQVQRLQFICGRDLESPYNVFVTFRDYLNQCNTAIFTISESNQNLTVPLAAFSKAMLKEGRGKPDEYEITPSLGQDTNHYPGTLTNMLTGITKSSKEGSPFLYEQEHDLLMSFEKVAKGGCSAFLFYGYPYFDSRSKALVHLLISGKLNNGFPFLEKATYYFLCDTEESREAYYDVKLYPHIDLTLTEPTIDDIPEILKEMAPTISITKNDQEALFHISSGRLSIIAIILRYGQDNGVPQRRSQAEFDLIAVVLDAWMAGLGEVGQKMKDVLKVAAIMGNPFSIALLQQVLYLEPECASLLKKSQEEFLIRCNGDRGEFYYREIWYYFYQSGFRNDFQPTSLAIAQAIYYFNPYDYLTRAAHLKNAGQIQTAFELYIFAYHTIIQEGFQFPQNFVDEIAYLANHSDQMPFWIMVSDCLQAIEITDYEKALKIIESAETPSSTRLLLIKEYIEGLCRHRIGETDEQRKNAIITIEQVAKSAKGFEDGLWCDCMTTLLPFYISLGDMQKAQQISQELAHYYAEHEFSPFAQKSKHALERKWSAFYPVENAVVKTRSSVEFFRDSNYSVQYIMALNNHAANLIVLHELDEAMEFLNEALEFLSNYKYTPVNIMHLISNFYLCSVLRKDISPKEAFDKLYPELGKLSGGDARILAGINCAIFSALAGNLDQSLQLLVDLEEKSISLNNEYFLYYIRANLATVQYLQGDASGAIDILKTYCQKPPLICEETKKTLLMQRTTDWISIMESEPICGPYLFDTYLIEQKGLKPQESFFARGFLYTDIQFCSEL